MAAWTLVMVVAVQTDIFFPNLARGTRPGPVHHLHRSFLILKTRLLMTSWYDAVPYEASDC
jgi:hypothetical protein